MEYIGKLESTQDMYFGLCTLWSLVYRVYF